VRDVVALGDDVVVVTDLARGGGLAALVARRRSLTAGQVVTLVAPIAQTLAAVHERGLAHGRVSMSNVVLDQDGRPVLTDWSLAGDGDSAADVAALAAMALHCLGDEAPDSVLSALRSATDGRTLAVALLSSVPAEPLLALPTTPADNALPADPHPATRRGAVGIIAVVAIAVAVALGGGILWGRSDSAAGGAMQPRIPLTATLTPTAKQVGVDWVRLVQHLERQRVRALINGDAASLARIEIRGTPLWRHDARLLTQLRDTHARLSGRQVRVRSVRVQSVQRRLVVLRVADAFSSYNAVDLRLRRVNGAWLIAGVSRRSR